MIEARSPIAAPSFRAVEHYSDDEHVMGGYGNLVVIVSLAPPTPEIVRASVGVTRRVARDHPQGLGMFVVIDSQAGPPDEASRKAIHGYYTELRDVVRGAVHVVEGEGFVSAAKRGALTLLNLTAKPPFPTRIAATLDEGAFTIRKVLGPLWIPEMQPKALSLAMLEFRAPLTRS